MIQFVKYLVEHIADIIKTNKDNKTPLFNVCKNGNESIIKYQYNYNFQKKKKYIY